MSVEQPARGVEILRLFVAIELPEPARCSLEDAISVLQREGATQGLRWVRPEGIHLTLQFLGATAAERVPSVGDALAAAVRGIPPFELAPGGIGSFGGRSRMRVIWIAVGREQALADLAARVRGALGPAGFVVDREEFRAHLTLARVRDDVTREERERLYDLIRSVALPVMPKFTVERINLMQSILGPGGAQYRAVATFPLTG